MSNLLKLHLKALGAAPVLPRNKFTLQPHELASVVEGILLKRLGCSSSERIYMYVAGNILVQPDEEMGALMDMFGTELAIPSSVDPATGEQKFQTDKELIISYSLVPIFG